MTLYLAKTHNLSIEHHELFEDIAKKTRISFTELISDLSGKHRKNIDWWVSELASRNTFSTSGDLFLNLCYLQLVEILVKRGGKLDIVLVDSKPLAKVLKTYFHGQEERIKILVESNLSGDIKNFFYPFADFLVTLISRYRIRKAILGTGKNDLDTITEPITIVDTFLFIHSIKDGKYVDRYYNHFSNYLSEEEKKTIYYVPTFILNKNLVEIVGKLRKSGTKFLFIDELLRFSDYLFAFTYPFRMVWKRPAKVKFNNFDISPLIREVWYRTLFEHTSVEALLKYRFAKRLKESGLRIRLILEWFENQVIDKGAIAGYRKYLPDTFIKGYQLGIDHPYFLCFYPTSLEKEMGLLPDEISVTGQGFVQLVKEFCTDLNVSVAPGYRYQYLWKKRSCYPEENYFTILVVLSIVLWESSETLEKIAAIDFRKLPSNIRIWLKPHPSNSIEAVLNAYNKELPPSFEFIEGDFNSYMERSNLVVGGNSTALFETLVRGVPVIIIGSRRGIMQNPIPSKVPGELYYLCYTTDEIENIISDLLIRDEKIKNDFVEKCNKIKHLYFEPVTEENTRKLLGFE